jgi:hypothetical protein
VEKLADSQLVSWEYWGEVKDTKKLGWHSFNNFELVSNKLTLEKDNTDELQEVEISGIKSRWIRCITLSPSVTQNLKPTATNLQDVKLDTIKVTAIPFTKDATVAGFFPDIAFYNDVPIPTGKDFYPFGKEPYQFDTFYFASQEAFSNKGVPLTLQFKIKQPEEGLRNKIEEPILSWEYWNGKSWNVLIFQGEHEKQVLNFTKQEEKIEQITFICPEDIKPTSVNGEEQYWLRIRLVEGDYGREVLRYNPETHETIGESRFDPPHLEDFTISYASLGCLLDYCLTFNNLQYHDKTSESQAGGKPFSPFQSLDDQDQALYLGFDAPPLNGPISIFFSLEIQTYTEKSKPYLNWEYYRQPNGVGEWSRLEVQDETFSLTQSGTVEFFSSPDFAQTSRFGKSLYWIRVTDVGDKFKPQERTHKKAIALDSKTFSPEQIQQFYRLFLSNQAFKSEPTPDQVQFFNPEFLLTQVSSFAPAPKIKGIYLNTTWVAQARMIRNQILGSSNGTANQTFQLFQIPIISEELWVNELSVLTSYDTKDLLAQASQGKIQVDEVKDSQGNTKEFWIKWEPRDELLESTSLDRHYEIDRTSGQITFGNGTQGAIPPIGANNIRANYIVGGGSQGNVRRDQITSLRTSIAYVNRVTNPEPANGGSDTELLEKALILVDSLQLSILPPGLAFVLAAALLVAKLKVKRLVR